LLVNYYYNELTHFVYFEIRRSERKAFGSGSGDSSDISGNADVFLNPAAAFSEDPFIDSDSSSNLSDSITRGVLDAIYHS